MKIGVSSYSYIRLTRAGEMTLKETIAKAKEQGFDVIEILGLSSQAPDCRDPGSRRSCVKRPRAAISRCRLRRGRRSPSRMRRQLR